MQHIISRQLLFVTLWLFASTTLAETLYVIDELNIGLHQDRSINSPIMKLVPSGTALSVIERADDLIHVQEPEGIRGWINSKYAISEKPGRASLVELENKNKKLQKEIEILKSKNAALSNTTPSSGPSASDELEQQLKSERLKVGELQAQLADIKANIAGVGGSDKLHDEIKQLQQENQQLIAQLQSSGVVVETTTGTSKDHLSTDNWKQLIISLIITFVIGMGGGAFALDYLNRRRHGGFRV